MQQMKLKTTIHTTCTRGCVLLILQSVVLPVAMEEHVVLPLPLLPVSAPVYMIVSYLQTVVQLVRMEELVMLHLTSLAVTVLVITQDTTASRKVHKCTLWTTYAADGP